MQLVIIIIVNFNQIFIFDLIFNNSNTNNLNSNTKQRVNQKILIIVDFIGFFNKKKIFKTLTQNIIFDCVREIENCVRDLLKLTIIF